MCWVFVAACELLVAACMWDLVPWPGIEPRPPALGAWSLIHCATREVLTFLYFKKFYSLSYSLLLIASDLPGFPITTKIKSLNWVLVYILLRIYPFEFIFMTENSPRRPCLWFCPFRLDPAWYLVPRCGSSQVPSLRLWLLHLGADNIHPLQPWGSPQVDKWLPFDVLSKSCQPMLRMV